MSTPPPARRDNRGDGRSGRPVDARGKAVSHTGEILTAVDVERSITRISDELETMVTTLAHAAETAARAEVAWKKARARVRMATRVAGGYGPGGRATEDECEDAAVDKHDDLLCNYLITEAAYAATRDAMFVRRSQLEALRTVAANIRANA